LTHAGTIAATAIGALLLTACAGAPVLRERLPDTTALELQQTPFFPQAEYQCGPAALATVLAGSGIEVNPLQLVEQVFLPGRHGSLQVEMLAAARRHGRVAVPLSGGLPGLAAALAAGQAVLVLQNLAFDFWPVWHYAVVVGLDPASDEVVLRSGTEQRLAMPARRFLVSWKRAGNWAFTVSDPQRPPAYVDARSWIEAASALEAAGQAPRMLQAFEAAAGRWPDDALVWQALGNGRYSARDRPGAVAAWRRALRIKPMLETYNNLAYTLGELGCTGEGERLLAQGLAAASGSPWQARLLQTQRELEAMAPKPCVY